MHVIFTLVRLLPYWVLTLAFAFVEFGVFFKRRRHRVKQFACWTVAALLLATIVAWFVFRGDLHSDAWVRYVFE
jgi:hypothetical protein